MFEIDHVVTWTPERDTAVAALAALTGLPARDGYAPDGRLQARGLRFANGPFLDIHAAPADGRVLMGLEGPLIEAQALADRQGWRTKAGAGPDEPWDMLSFRKGQGLLTQLFVIDYRPEQVASRSAFNRGLYHLPPTGGPRLARVWIATTDTAQAGVHLAALGFAAAGAIRSDVAPFEGQLHRGPRADVVLCSGEDSVIRIDAPTAEPLQTVALGARLTAVVGRDQLDRASAS